jgi:hypothetical protein
MFHSKRWVSTPSCLILSTWSKRLFEKRSHPSRKVSFLHVLKFVDSRLRSGGLNPCFFGLVLFTCFRLLSRHNKSNRLLSTYFCFPPLYLKFHGVFAESSRMSLSRNGNRTSMLDCIDMRSIFGIVPESRNVNWSTIANRSEGWLRLLWS